MDLWSFEILNIIDLPFYNDLTIELTDEINKFQSTINNKFMRISIITIYEFRDIFYSIIIKQETTTTIKLIKKKKFNSLCNN